MSTCPHCSQEVSEQSETCPHCGRPVADGAIPTAAEAVPVAEAVPADVGGEAPPASPVARIVLGAALLVLGGVLTAGASIPWVRGLLHERDKLAVERRDLAGDLAAERRAAAERKRRLGVAETKTASLGEALERMNDRGRAWVGEAEQLRSMLGAQERNVSALREEVGAQAAKSRQLADEKAGVERKLVQQTAKADTLESNLKEMTAKVENMDSMLDTLRTELQAQRVRSMTTEEKLRTTSEMLVETQTRLMSAQAVAKRLREELIYANKRIEVLEQPLAGPAKPKGPTTRPAPGGAIGGTITAVDLEHKAASINLGSKQGVTEGMVFFVYRGSELVGRLRIAEVDANESAGMLSLLQSRPRVGDKVTTKL